MKKVLALSLAMSAIIFSASAQEKRDPAKDQQGKHQRHHGQGQGMKDLNLSEAQKTQMKADREAYKTKLQALSNDKSLSATELASRKAALHNERKAKMESVLTSDQKSKIAANKTAMQARHKEMAEKRSAEMKSKLGLNDDQAAKLKSQRDAAHAQMKAIKDDQSLSKEAKKERLKALKESTKEQRKSILTADQISKMDQMKKDHKHKGDKKGRKSISK